MHQTLLLEQVHDKVHALSALGGVLAKPVQRPLFDSVLDAPASKVADKGDLVLRPGAGALTSIRGSLLDLENVPVLEIRAPRLHLHVLGVDDGLFDDPRLGNVLEEGLDEPGQTALLEHQPRGVQLSVGVHVSLNGVCGKHVRGVRIGVPVEKRQRDCGEVVTELVRKHGSDGRRSERTTACYSSPDNSML